MSSQHPQSGAPEAYPYPYPPPPVSTAPAPPPPGYPTKEGSYNHQTGPSPGETKSKGDGFWKGCCAALCCCCLVDACF